jgi:hypothetical protein
MTVCRTIAEAAAAADRDAAKDPSLSQDAADLADILRSQDGHEEPSRTSMRPGSTRLNRR